VSPRRRIYLDHAATSWPKPQSVYEVVDDYQRRLGAAVGRGGSPESEEAAEKVDDVRVAIARLIGAETPERIVFTLNGTDSLNLAIHGLVRTGDHVVTTVVEHNSVLRPLRWLEKREQISVTRVGCDAAGIVSPDAIRAALRPNTKLVVVTHASNVTGAIQPAAAIGEIARRHGADFLLDAAQTVGHLPVSVTDLGADLLAAPGHKGLLGPLGTGFLYVRPGLEGRLNSVRQGGTGSASSSDEQPEELPGKYEPGNLNVGGILGLGAGLRFIEERGIVSLRNHAAELSELLMSRLEAIPGLRLYGPRPSDQKAALISFTLDGRDSPAVAKMLSERFGVQTRAGFQCAALMHRVLQTAEFRGTVRMSIGPFNTREEIVLAADAVAAIAASSNQAVAPVSCACVSGSRSDGSAAPLLPADGAQSSASGRQTDISKIPGIPELWSETVGDPRVCIALLDGPVDLSHSCFQGASLQVHPAYEARQTSRGGATVHGTHVASVIFGQHGGNVKGVAPQCSGVILPIFSDGSDGAVVPCSQVDLARAITQAVAYAEEKGFEALVINVSGGQPSPSGAAHPLLNDVVKTLDPEKHLIVAAAGNQGCDCLQVPGAIPTVLTVGAMDHDGNPLAFSNWGEAYRSQGILAPGDHIVGAVPGGELETRSGTSYAAPIVSGVAALLLSRQMLHCRSPSAKRVQRGLLASAVSCELKPAPDCRKLLAGRLDVVNALFTLTQEGCAVMTTELLHAPSTSGGVDLQGLNPASSPMSHSRVDAVLPAGLTANGPMTGDPLNSQAVMPAGCGCGGGAPAPAAAQKVYAIGRLGYDFGTRQRREYFRSQIGNPDDPGALIERLTERIPANYTILEGRQFANRIDVTNLTWVLMLDETPVYALAPVGAFAFETHDTLVRFLQEQLPAPPSEAAEKKAATRLLFGEGVERMSVGGQIVGETRLYTGEVVPLIALDHRTLANWTTAALITAMRKISGKDVDARVEALLDRLYELTRNLGVSSQDRALNYAATNALILQSTLADDRNKAKFADLEIDDVDVRPSAVCRPDYDCWEVTFTFYDPDNLNRARRGFRYTIDVSDTLPQIIAGSENSFTLR